MNKSMIIAAVVIALGLFAVAGGIFYVGQQKTDQEVRVEKCDEKEYYRWSWTKNKCEDRSSEIISRRLRNIEAEPREDIEAEPREDPRLLRPLEPYTPVPCPNDPTAFYPACAGT